MINIKQTLEYPWVNYFNLQSGIKIQDNSRNWASANSRYAARLMFGGGECVFGFVWSVKGKTVTFVLRTRPAATGRTLPASVKDDTTTIGLTSKRPNF